MKIIVDAMGGDNAPFEIVKGSVEATKELGVEIVGETKMKITIEEDEEPYRLLCNEYPNV